MTGAMISLLLVTVAFLGLLIWVMLPGSRNLQRHADIPFADDTPAAEPERSECRT